MAVAYFGTKRAFISTEINAGLQDDPVLPDSNVQWKVYLDNETDASLYDSEGVWTYDCDSDTILVISEDPELKVQAVYGRSVEAPLLITLMQTVCLNGAETRNPYQGRVDSISAKFQAIQASHAGE